MEEYMKLFFEGEALQQIITCFCNTVQKRMSVQLYLQSPLILSSHNSSSSKNKHANTHGNTQNPATSAGTTSVSMVSSSGTNSIAKVLCTMIKSQICLRLTTVGLAPIAADITLVLPYTQMSKIQMDYLQDILKQASFNASAHTADPIKAIGYGSEVVIITTLHGQSIWRGNAVERPPLHHIYERKSSSSSSSVSDFHAPSRKKARKNTLGDAHTHNTSGNSMKAQQLIMVADRDNGQWRNESAVALEEACHWIHGQPLCANGTIPVVGQKNVPSWHLDASSVLKAFCACVFRSRVHTDTCLREGICNIILQMVIGEVGTTRDILQSVSAFVHAARQL